MVATLPATSSAQGYSDGSGNLVLVQGGGSAPAAPSGFAVTYLSDTSLSLSWTDNSGDETGFEIERSLNGTSGWTQVLTPAADATSATNGALTVDTQYFYRLRSINGSGNSAWVEANGTTTAPSVTADYPLEIIQPRAGLDTTNRFYKAYPGIEYNVRMGVIGGIYEGFVYSLTTAPSGMTINAATGEIVWANPTETGSPHSITAQITDGEATQTVSWTLTVTTSGFKFVDSVNGLDTNDGSIGSPWQTLDKITDAANTDFVYFRTGTYSTAQHYDWDGNLYPCTLLAYPSETVNFDLAAGGFFFFNTNNKLYVDGFSVDSNNNTNERAFAYGGDQSNVTFRRNTFQGLLNGSAGSNPSYIFSGGADTRGSYTSIQDNTVLDGGIAYFFLGYCNSRVLVEDNAMSNLTNIAVSPKDGNDMWFIRRNDISSYIGIALQSFDSRSMGKGPLVIEYNNIETTGGENQTVSFAGYAQDGPIYVRRNTLIGRNYNFLNSSSNPAMVYSKNVIINDSDLGETDRLRMDNGTFGVVVYDDNLVGGSGDGIVDANGNLTGASRTTYLGTHGYEVA